MKAYLIKASAPGPFKEYKKYMGAPPQNIFSMAACTPAHVKYDMCDETADMRPNMRTDADVIAILFHTPDAPHAYKMADTFRAKGKTVVLGGLHATALPDEAARHADSLLIGEVEDIWEQLLEDFSKGQLKKRYQRSGPVDMSTLNPYPTHLIKPRKYNDVWSVLVSRGCVHRCEYCAVPPFFRGKYRLRPVEQVVAEIKAAPATWFELHADNLTADRDYAIELFKALKPLNISWIGESTIRMADDEELLKLAGESGCKYLLIGIETPSQAALDKSGKAITTPKDVRDRIRQFHKYGIKITSSMIFGFDTHTTDIFKESLEFSREIEIDEVEAVLLAPFPGTPLYDRMKKEGRLLTDDWAKYDCANVVFKPKGMTVKELNEGSYWFWQQINKKGGGFSLFTNTMTSPTGGARESAPSKPALSAPSGPSSPSGGSIKWKSMLALALIGVSIALDQYWLWGVIFIFWLINDLKNGYTYLLELIHRRENPILYWTIVLLWTFFALWALSTAPLINPLVSKYIPGSEAATFTAELPAPPEAPSEVRSEVTPPATPKGRKSTPVATSSKAAPQKKTPVPVATQQPAPAQKQKPSDEALKEANAKVFSDPGSGMSVTIPASWQTSTKAITGGRQMDATAPKGTATLTCVSMDMGMTFKEKAYITMMEGELKRDIPFITKGAGQPAKVKRVQVAGNDMVFKEYLGTMKGQPVTAVVGYGMDKKKGYLLIAVIGQKDHPMDRTIRQSLSSFNLK